MKKSRKHNSAGAGVCASGSVVALIMLIYFFSGVCSLIDEVVWVRLLKLTLGNTVYASSIVVSTFMGGLALGALIMGRYADRIGRRLRTYAVLELCVTISALLMPVGLHVAQGLYRWYFARFEDSTGGLLLLQAAISGVLLLAPTILMGSTLPLLGRFITELEDRVGRLVGRLYALNTLGAALGCFVAGFVLIRLFGVMGTLFVAAGLNLLVAAGGWLLSRSADSRAGQAVQQAPSEAGETVGVGGGGQYLLMAAFFCSGLISISYEIIWMRSIVVPLGGFTYVFSGVLTVYLLGNVVGAWIGSRLASRLRSPGAMFGVSLAVLGVLGVFYVPWFRTWFSLLENSQGFTALFAKTLGVASIRKVSLPMFHSFALFMAPSIAMGVGFPLALQAWAGLRHKVGLTTGTVYGVNTIGAVLGGLVAGFVLIPEFGVQRSTLILGLAGIWLGGLMIRSFYRGSSGLVRIGAPAAVVALSMAAVFVPSDLFLRTLARTYGGHILEVRDGVTTTVAVSRKDDGSTVMAIDNIEMAGDGIRRSAQNTLGHLPVLLHGHARDVLTFGFGSGETSYCLAQHDLERIDCVEIAPEVEEMALKYFRHINLGDQLDEKVNMIFMDGKNYLAMTPRRYDIIINDSNVHSTAASAPLFTKEHFTNALNHLKDGGLFMTKLHLRAYPASDLRSIIGTFNEVFGDVTVWFPVTRPFVFVYLIGSRGPQRFDPVAIDAEMARPAVRASVSYLGFEDSTDVLSCYLGDKADFERYLTDYTTNSDYHPFIEFNMATDEMSLPGYFPQMLKVVRQGSIANHIDYSSMSQQQKQQWSQKFAKRYEVASMIMQAHGEQAFVSQLECSYKGLKLVPGHPGLLSMQSECLEGIDRAASSGLVKPASVVGQMDKELARHPDMGMAWLIKSVMYALVNDASDAVQAGRKAVELMPENAEALTNLGLLLARTNNSDAAIGYLKHALSIDPKRSLADYAMAMALANKGQSDEALAYYDKAVELRPAIDTSIGLHVKLAENYIAAGLSDKALGRAQRALELARRAGDAVLQARAGELIQRCRDGGN